MENYSQKDDMTRVGGFIRPSSPAGKSEKDSSQVETPPPSSYWQGSPSVAPSRPASSSDPSPPSFPTPDRYHLSPQQDDMWFVVELSGQPVEYPLRHGESITIGRDPGQNIVIADKTLSRNHLVLQRNGDRITVQVLGLNGLVYSNQVYKSTSLEVVVPCSITIGNVLCRIKKKIDSDATILMSDPASAARQHPGAGFSQNDGAFASRQAQSFFPSPSPPSWPPKENPPFGKPAEEEKFPFAADQPIPPVFPAGQPGTKFPGSSAYSPPSFDFGSIDSPPDDRRGGMSPEASSVYEDGGKPDSSKGLLIVGGIIGLGVLIVVVGLFFWLHNPFALKEGGNKVEQAISTKTPEPSPIKQDVPQPQTNNLYGQYLTKAKHYFEEGKSMDACDYLKDIPPTSAYRTEAVELAKQIPGCKL